MSRQKIGSQHGSDGSPSADSERDGVQTELRQSEKRDRRTSDMRRLSEGRKGLLSGNLSFFLGGGVIRQRGLAPILFLVSGRFWRSVDLAQEVAILFVGRGLVRKKRVRPTEFPGSLHESIELCRLDKKHNKRVLNDRILSFF